MKPRVAVAVVAYVAAACLVSVLGFAAKTLTPEPGLVRSIYTQAGFGGTPIEERASEINLDFLNARPELPREFFGVRWRGFLFLDRSQTIEFFAGGNDRVELRVDGQLLLRRNIEEGMRTIGRTLPLEAGSHEIVVEYEQFGGSMALNIQRAIAGGAPGPFESAELFTQSIGPIQVSVSRAGHQLQRIGLAMWMGLPVALVIAAAPWAVKRWRAEGDPREAPGIRPPGLADRRHLPARSRNHVPARHAHDFYQQHDRVRRFIW